MSKNRQDKLLYRFLLTSDVLPAYELETDPKGWEGLRYIFLRDPKYHGIALEMTTDLTFVKRGADYIRTAYEAFGVEGVIYLSIYQYNPNEFRHFLAFRGRADLTRYTSSEQGVTVPLKEEGFTTKFLSRDSVEVDLFKAETLDGTALPTLEPVSVLMHSQQLRKEYVAPKKDTTIPAQTQNFVTNGNSRFQTLYFGFGTPEIDDFQIGQMAGGSFSILPGEAAPIYTAREDGLFTLEFTLAASLLIEQGDDQPFPLKTPSFEKVDLDVYVAVNGVKVATLASYRDTVSKTQDYRRALNLRFADELELKAGDRLFFYADLHVYDITENDPLLGQYSFRVTPYVGPGSRLSIAAVTTTAPTTAGGLLLHEALERVAQQITDQDRPVLYSEHYGRTDLGYAIDGPGALRLLTSGFQLRGFPLSEQSIYASFRDLFDASNDVDCLGLGVERRGGRERLRVEPRKFFYQPVEVVRLGAVTELRKSVRAEMLFNQAQVGYSRWQSGADNGLDEFNGTRNYTLPLSQVAAEYTAVSKYAAAGILIEETRRKRYDSTRKQEGAADKNNFFICLRRSGEGFATEQAEAFTAVTGIQAGTTAYNLRISPARNLRRHGAWLRAGLRQREDGKLVRGAVEGNDRLTSRLGGEPLLVDEHADVPVLELPAPYVAAETYEFTSALPLSQLAQLRANPYGLISFLDGRGMRKSGYVLKVERANSGKTTFQLLRAV